MTASGPFSLVSGRSDGVQDSGNYDNIFLGFGFDASIANELYGKSNCIQPKSLMVYKLVRI